MSCTRLNMPSTCKFTLENTAITSVLRVVIRARLRYEGGVGGANIYVKDSGGSTIVSKACSVTGSYTTFEETATGSWTDTDVNDWRFWCEFDSGDTPGVNDIRLTAAEIQVYDSVGDGDPASTLLSAFGALRSKHNRLSAGECIKRTIVSVLSSVTHNETMIPVHCKRRQYTVRVPHPKRTPVVIQSNALTATMIPVMGSTRRYTEFYPERRREAASAYASVVTQNVIIPSIRKVR